MHNVQYIRVMLTVSLAPIGIELTQLVLYVLLQSQFAWVLCVCVFFYNRQMICPYGKILANKIRAFVGKGVDICQIEMHLYVFYIFTCI